MLCSDSLCSVRAGYLSISLQLCRTQYVTFPATKGLDMMMYFCHISAFLAQSKDKHLVGFLCVDITSDK